MNRKNISASLLVLVYTVFVAGRAFRLATEDFSLLVAAGLVLDVIVLLALLLVVGSWARRAGIIASWIKIALASGVATFGAIRLATLDTDGFGYLVLGSLFAAVAFWTISVLQSIERQSKAVAADRRPSPPG